MYIYTLVLMKQKNVGTTSFMSSQSFSQLITRLNIWHYVLIRNNTIYEASVENLYQLFTF